MEDFYLTVTYILAGVLGLCVGSFLNVVIYRVPNGMKLYKPASHCPNCDYKLKWYDNIPIISYIILGGRCRSCKQHISFRYTIVEIINTLLWLLCVLLFWNYSKIYAITCALICSTLICVFFIDLENMFIPDRFHIILCVLAVFIIIFGKEAWYNYLIGAAVGGGVFWLVGFIGEKKKGQEVLGLGDVKLAFASGLILGWKKFILAMLIASISASIVIACLNAKNKENNNKEYPFAPFITTGVALALFLGDLFIEFYLGLFGFI